jgi:hypothetical protein
VAVSVAITVAEVVEAEWRWPVVGRLDMYHTKVLMYHTMVLMACLTKVRC